MNSRGYCNPPRVISLIPVSLSSLEKRYKFSSTQLGMLPSTFDFVTVLVAIFISYFGGKRQKPKLLGVGCFIQGIGALVFSLPQFVTEDYKIGKHANLSLEECSDPSDFSPECDDNSNNVYFLFIIAMILLGLGASPLFTVGISYIDDIVHPNRSPIWLGIFTVLVVVGPTIGFGLGGAFLTIYVDPWTETTLEQTDTGWVGAWWIGFVLFGVLSLVLSVPFFMFPETYPDTYYIQQERIKQMSIQRNKQVTKEDLNKWPKPKDLPKQFLDLMARLPFLFMVLAFSGQIFVVAGLVVFFPKYVEAQFGFTASTAGLVSGAVSIFSAGTGIILGALLVFFLKPPTRRLTLYYTVINLVSAVFLFGFFLRCSTYDVAGVTVPYPDSTLFDDQTLNATCNSHCNCKSTIFEPVCSDGITYFSPCRAGCDKYLLNGDRDEPRFENCTCSTSPSGRAGRGFCDENCKVLAPFLIVVAITLITNMATQIPNLIITLRCIADEQRSLALGIQSVFVRIFGSIPGPIVMGAIFDSSCAFWQEECGDRGNCYVLDNEDLSLRLFLITVAVRIISVAFGFLAWGFFNKTLCNRGIGVDEENENEMKDVNPIVMKDTDM
ncbi:solute carrier organic anion transporter family member 4C1-like isoform X2 [Dysidea avara]|uniref:solute carrier organic anion transporter family member 4C1-like isoform X2 n=1 Tax=Dysidea avara TaxID=196820 RepID=UPI0033228B15